MNCNVCGAVNPAGRAVCENCGAALPSADVRTDPNGYPIFDEGESLAGSRKGTAKNIAVGSQAAIEKDLKGLRPLTRTAYQIVRADNTPWIKLGLYVSFVVLCFAIIATIMGIFDTMKTMVQAQLNSGSDISTGLRDIIYKAQAGDSLDALIWLSVLLVVLIFVYVLVGRLILRIQKVRRKKKRKEQRDMI
ncbi:MAG: zinc finger Ran-binding domain-containing protein [Oscillospiraceae bacterium]|jgi:uncharacterized membrane protein|nr:zinc finger Ran-binding domain-containing protein [Oscillospiraceae bacterium]